MMPLAEAIRETKEGIRYLAPEIVLLYKSKHLREQDIADDQAVNSSLADTQLRWLNNALSQCEAGQHPWLEREDQVGTTG